MFRGYLVFDFRFSWGFLKCVKILEKDTRHDDYKIDTFLRISIIPPRFKGIFQIGFTYRFINKTILFLLFSYMQITANTAQLAAVYTKHVDQFIENIFFSHLNQKQNCHVNIICNLIEFCCIHRFHANVLLVNDQLEIFQWLGELYVTYYSHSND